ncbi:MAG: shikimate kinase [Rectinema subterraneum]|jgi:shikimate kinase|uniref:Shikimate kinase n=1 Tax=uncultured spirochete TaxID=156406 RepID=A0A3P3XFQ0_9SPIR|nr:shikimate kinase [Rectinema subterraneum]SLM09942.1 Shikimate kinase [uncultured spirochete]HBE46762.1 shikimate kinase [Spirochaetaceae bacterium]
MKIALIGMMGSGKTKIGQLLAAHYGIDFLDLDHIIEQRVGLSISEIFAQKGETEFRKIEESTLAEVVGLGKPLVLACGGGVVLMPSNRELLESECITVWLDVPLRELARRLAGEKDSRPLLASSNWQETLKEIYDARHMLYKETASIRYVWKENCSIDTSIQRIAQLIDSKKAEFQRTS